MITRLPSALASTVAAALSASAPALAQGPAFQTPGQPTFGMQGIDATQATGFTSGFNPAVSFIVDAAGSYESSSGRGEDGFDLELRAVELGLQAWVDPNAWAYFIGVADEEEVAVEEAAIQYVGFEGNSTLRAGRFFLDFGKQMQLHPHELRTLERPLALREYLGEEVAGDGVRWEHWMPAGDSTIVRWSLGAFASLLPEHGHGDEEEEGAVELETEDRLDLGELSYSARLTGFRDVSEHGMLQLGASARTVPSFSAEFEDTGDAAGDLSNTVYGLDLTYGWISDTALERWTLGGEFLLDVGDTGFENPAPGTVDVLDDTLAGWYAFVDHAWGQWHSVGLQVSMAEVADGADRTEVEVYYTRELSEFQRLRFVVGGTDADDEDDVLRCAIQYTAVLGPHAHGINW